MLEPRKLIPFSTEYCKAPIAVMTEITEKTPMVMPSIVSAERSLFAPSEADAILMISPKSMVFQNSHKEAAEGAKGADAAALLCAQNLIILRLFIAKGRYWIET